VIQFTVMYLEQTTPLQQQFQQLKQEQ